MRPLLTVFMMIAAATLGASAELVTAPEQSLTELAKKQGVHVTASERDDLVIIHIVKVPPPTPTSKHAPR